jgi:hypothetical protein
MSDYDYEDYWQNDEFDGMDTASEIGVECILGETYKELVESPLEAKICPICSKLIDEGSDNEDDIFCKHSALAHGWNKFVFMSYDYLSGKFNSKSIMYLK